tara:strand:- start:74160 stop:76046 length:1887 start_codon:yes stop_codon:yes gene_type:complete
MKIITKITFGVFAFIFTLSVYAQTPQERQKIISSYNIQLLNQLQADTEADYQRKRQEALALAEIYNWPETYETDNGGSALLVDVIDETYPVYLETTNFGAAITARADKLYPGGLLGLDLQGQDMLIGVWDGGRTRETHQLLEGRAVQIDGASSFSSHATHVTGTIIGSGAFQSGNAQGMAPLAETVNSDFSNDISEVIAANTTYGLLVSNHSYGVPADQVPAWYLGYYDSTARIYDQIQYTTPYFLPVFAAGNARNTNHPNQGDGGFDILTGHSVAKNNLVVAASFQVPNYTGPASVSMSPFSSWGPTDDGRIKPDITAKGVNTFSSTAVSNASYSSFSGTSMAAPSVAGVLALLQEHYNNINNQFMLSSTLRGLVLHTADEAGAHPGPDYRFGWGLINAERAAEVITNRGTTSVIAEYTLTEGEVLEFSGSSIPGERLVASITWTDRQGNILPQGNEDVDTPSLINDLDLRVINENDDEFFPWILDHTNFGAAATTGDNFRDNIEKVEIDDPSGDYVFRVTHKGELWSDEQVVSIIISGVENVVLSNPENDFVSASIFPNPAQNELNIRAITQISQVEIMNLLGQSFGVTDVNANTTKLDISNLNTGTYFVRVTIDNASKVYKFIKK